MAKKNKLCISIRGFKRPDYLRECLQSLERNFDLTGVDFYFFQDGSTNPYSGKTYATSEEIKRSFEVFWESKLPNKTIFQSGTNLGPANRNRHQLEVLFPIYEYVVLADNDLVFNKYYIKTLKTLFKQFRKDKKAGIIQTSFRHENRYQEKDEAKKLENAVAYGFSHFNEMGFWRHTWEKIKPHMALYFDLIKECDFHEYIHNPKAYKEIKEELRDHYGAFLDGPITTEDYALARAAQMAGYQGLHTLSLRHRTIGEKGMFSFSKDRWEKDGFAGIPLFDVGNVNKYTLINV